jgi:peptidoglycan/LPS O-acetylase OafA/YrhL
LVNFSIRLIITPSCGTLARMRSAPVRPKALGWVRLDSRDNALNAVRLLLALVVVVSHSWDVIHGPKLPWANPGAVAVDGFFALSGFLIAGSRRRLSPVEFAWRRILRILPGYAVALVTTGAVVAPLLALALREPYDLADGTGFVVNNAGLVIRQTGIGSLLSDVPVANVFNASLWTLAFEGAAYVTFGLLLTGSWLTTRAASLILGALSLLAASQWGVGLGPFPDPQLPRLFAFFAAGVTLWLARDTLSSSGLLAAVGLAAVVLTNFLAPYWLYLLIAPVPMAYGLLWLGANARTRVGQRNDISFGVYVHAFPLQQALVATRGAAALGPVWFALVSVLVVLPFAWASWLWVERPAMRLRGFRCPPWPRPKGGWTLEDSR